MTQNQILDELLELSHNSFKRLSLANAEKLPTKVQGTPRVA